MSGFGCRWHECKVILYDFGTKQPTSSLLQGHSRKTYGDYGLDAKH